jgi:hypothetical protein
MTKGENTKSEARNPKQIQNDERQNTINVPNKIDRIPRFGFFDFEISLASVCFGFGASDFGFTIVEFVSIRGAAFDIRISGFASLAF